MEEPSPSPIAPEPEAAVQTMAARFHDWERSRIAPLAVHRGQPLVTRLMYLFGGASGE